MTMREEEENENFSEQEITHVGRLPSEEESEDSDDDEEEVVSWSAGVKDSELKINQARDKSNETEDGTEKRKR